MKKPHNYLFNVYSNEGGGGDGGGGRIARCKLVVLFCFLELKEKSYIARYKISIIITFYPVAETGFHNIHLHTYIHKEIKFLKHTCYLHIEQI